MLMRLPELLAFCCEPTRNFGLDNEQLLQNSAFIVLLVQMCPISMRDSAEPVAEGHHAARNPAK